MKAIYILPNNIQDIENHLAKLELDKDVKSVLFFMADDFHYSKEKLNPLLKQITKPIIGGMFPELIYQGERKKSGVLLVPLEFKLITQLFDLSQSPEEFPKYLEVAQKDSLNPSSALFIFMDALSSNKDSFIESLFNFFGINTSYIGGGAGSLSFKPCNCLISNDGVNVNAAVIGWADKKIALGVAHGWEPISEPLKITETDYTELKGINWKPAFEVYKEIVESHSGMKFKEDNFFDLAKSYPFGISKIDAEMVVRDPVRLTDNTIHFVDKISEGEYVNILHGNMESLLTGAAKAKEMAFSNSEEGMDRNTIFCIDCISRVLFMEDAFKEELVAIGQGLNVNGILTIGEIANSGESFLEIYNKTIVVAIW